MSRSREIVKPRLTGTAAPDEDARMWSRSDDAPPLVIRSALSRRATLLLPTAAALMLGAEPGCDDPVENSDDLVDDVDDSNGHEFRLSAIGANNPVTVGPTSSFGNETSAVGFPTNPLVKIFVSYNADPGTPRPDGTQTHCGWAHSHNGTVFNAYDDYAMPLPGYGNGSDGSAYDYCFGDTSSANVSWTESSTPMVAMVAIARNTGPGGCYGSHPQTDVAMWTSVNGGQTFTKVARLSNNGGCVDGPKVAWDHINHKAWVSWQDDSSGPMLRSVAIDNTGNMMLGAEIPLSGKLMFHSAGHYSIALKAIGGGQNPEIWLAYQSSWGTNNSCEDAPTHTTTDVTWWLSKSTNGGGGVWTHQQVANDPTWPFCISDDLKGNNRALINAVYDPEGDRVLVAYTRHIDDANGNYVGTRVVTAQTPRHNGAAGFDRWLPLCNPQVCPTQQPTGTSCLVNGAPPAGETFCHQFGAAIGVTGVGTRRVAVVWHDTRDSSLSHPNVGDPFTVVKPLESNIWGHAIRSGGPQLDCLAPLQCATSRITPLGPSVPWPVVGINGNAWWGDYEDGVVPYGSGFYAIWGDNRDGSNQTKLFGASFNE